MLTYKQFSFKKFGLMEFTPESGKLLGHPELEDFVKIAFVRAGVKTIIDFKEYQLERDALFFINSGQYFHFDARSTGTVIYYNRDFYCVEIHDAEVACDGLLFHNIYEIPAIFMDEETSMSMLQIIDEIKSEFEETDNNTEDMLRLMLKKIIIKAVRIWKSSPKMAIEDVQRNAEFSRRFSQLVEAHYHRLHTVSEYAALLNITPETLNKRITKYSGFAPNELIKKRITLQAQRLLAHTTLTVKEIGYTLGYEDPSYFVRLFANHVQTTPQSFRQQYQTSNS
jgi:AraC-like DNA-binding protein